MPYFLSFISVMLKVAAVLPAIRKPHHMVYLYSEALRSDNQPATLSILGI